MARIFHIATFLLFVAFGLLLVSSISSPVVPDIFFLKVTPTTGGSHISFGVFGYCTTSGSNVCSRRTIGYDIAKAISTATGMSYTSTSLQNITRGLVLHPVAAGLTFLALLIALSSRCLGFVFATAVAVIAWGVSLIALIIDLSLFATVKRHVNNDTRATAQFGVALWLTLAAFIILFFATITTCFSCFSHRRRKRYDHDKSAL